jgi:uncharacterized protein
MSRMQGSAVATDPWEELEDRLTPRLLEKRLFLQRDRLPRALLLSDSHVPCDSLPWSLRLGRAPFFVPGVSRLAQKSCTNFEVTRSSPRIIDLPRAFVGFKILHLSDLHLGGPWDSMPDLIRVVSGLSFDLCVITGDLRYPGDGDFGPALNDLGLLVRHITTTSPPLVVLGNHDYIQMLPRLESMGLIVLLNEHRRIERAGSGVSIAGVDDSYFFGTHDLDRALESVGSTECVVLLSHSPDLHAEAAKKGVGLYLCGHTHGGQICLPGGFPIISNSRSPRRLLAGAWSHEGMAGYTSRGVGHSGVPARFWCRPEITVHSLDRASAS